MGAGGGGVEAVHDGVDAVCRGRRETVGRGREVLENEPTLSSGMQRRGRAHVKTAGGV